MSALLVGVAAHTDASGLLATIDALRAATDEDDGVVLLPDGPDPPLADALAHDPVLSGLTQWATPEPLGGAASLNRLAAGACDGDKVAKIVLLESGARPAPDALRRLAAALDDPSAGIAGPSTNDSWNEQRAAPDATGDAAGLASTEAELLQRFGDAPRSLAPLYSIGDYCLAVSRQVLDAVGAADGGFHLGPCWEMEYAARVARAGFAVQWVPAAYVHRAPPTWRRRIEEARRFDSSRRRYQDRLCGLRLDGTRPGYAPHCEGDTCPHFAPFPRIALRLPLPVHPADAPVPTSLGTAAPRTTPVAQRPQPNGSTLPVRRAVAVTTPADLVSCVMPTADRAEWVAASIGYFQRQDHQPKELVIVDDGVADLRREIGDLLQHPAVVHVRIDERRSIGAKRNLGCQRARGDVLVQWDDDDWYGPDRLRAQTTPIVAGDADITGLRDAAWFELEPWRFRTPNPALHRRLFVEDVHGGTLAFRRAVWELGSRYPDASLAEDAMFLRQAIRRGARLRVLPADGRYLYVRHGTNSWRLPAGLEGPDGWSEVPEPPALHADRAFYAARSPAASGAVRRTAALASCIMPTADRRAHVPAAVAAFLGQTHPATELLVLDDGDQPVADLLPEHPAVRYLRLDRRLPLGTKRNLAVEAARGDVIVHFDDDDWSHPDRVRIQVNALVAGGTDLCGLDRMLWWDPTVPAAWRYTCPPLRRPWVAGNTLAYLRSTWERSPFPASAVGEDTAFVWGRPDRRVRALDDERLVVGTIHAGNTSVKHTVGAAWSPVDVDEIQALMQS